MVIIAHGHFLQGLTGGIIPHRTRGDSHHYLLHLNSQHTSCAIQHVPHQTSTGRLGTVRLVSESSTFFFKKKIRIAIRNNNSNGVCTATHFHAHFFSLSVVRHILTHCAHAEHFLIKRPDCQNHSIKSSFFLACLTRAQRTPHSRVGHPVTSSLSHSFAFSPRCLAARTFRRQTHISAGCLLLSAGAK